MTPKKRTVRSTVLIGRPTTKIQRLTRQVETKSFTHFEDWQIHFFNNAKLKALSWLGPSRGQLKIYEQDYETLQRRPFKVIDWQKFWGKLLKSKYIFLGDFHTFDQPSKNVLRIVNNLVENKKCSLAIGVEFVELQHQHYIDAYLNHYITENEFLECIGYQNNWRFPWNQYRNILLAARAHKIPVIALNSKGTLKKRDLKAAKIILETSQKLKVDKFLIFFGEYHIVKNKLPYDLLNLSKEKKDFRNLSEQDLMVIYQNLEGPYWKLHKRSVREKEIIQFSSTEYSLQTSPPWIKYEGLNYWFEWQYSSDESDIKYAIQDTQHDLYKNDAHEIFHQFSKKIASFFKTKIHQGELDAVKIWGPEKIKNYHKIIQNIKSIPEKSELTDLFNLQKPIFYSPKNILFIHQYSLNNIMASASTFYFSLISRKMKTHLMTAKKNQLNYFMFMILYFYFLHCGIKILNPHFKSELFGDLQYFYRLKKNRTIQQFSARFSCYNFFSEIPCTIHDQDELIDYINQFITYFETNSQRMEVAMLIGRLLSESHFELNIYQTEKNICQQISQKIKKTSFEKIPDLMKKIFELTFSEDKKDAFMDARKRFF